LQYAVESDEILGHSVHHDGLEQPILIAEAVVAIGIPKRLLEDILSRMVTCTSYLYEAFKAGALPLLINRKPALV